MPIKLAGTSKLAHSPEKPAGKRIFCLQKRCRVARRGRPSYWTPMKSGGRSKPRRLAEKYKRTKSPPRPNKDKKKAARWIHALSLRGPAQEMSGFWIAVSETLFEMFKRLGRTHFLELSIMRPQCGLLRRLRIPFSVRGLAEPFLKALSLIHI